MAHKELFLSWLNDAYAMEQNTIQVLQNHIKDAKDYSQMESRLQGHLEVTRRQAELVKGRIEALGGNVSPIKSAAGTVMGAVTGVTTAVAQDEIIKNSIADYATEHFEIASYKALVEAARDLGDEETVRVCQQILSEEEDMAHFLEQNLPVVVRDFVWKRAAKHREAAS